MAPPPGDYSLRMSLKRMLSRFLTAVAWSYAVIGIVLLALAALFILGWASFGRTS
jgi:hypothetical protein